MKALIVSLLLITAVPAMAAPASPDSSTASSHAPQVDIFVTSWCPYCRQLEAFLKKNRVEYTRYDVDIPQAAEIFEKIGGTGVPVTRIGKKVIHGYDPYEIMAALEEYK